MQFIHAARTIVERDVTHHVEKHAVVSGTFCVTDNGRLMDTLTILEFNYAVIFIKICVMVFFSCWFCINNSLSN